MSDWNIKDFPLFSGMAANAEVSRALKFPAFAESGFAVQTSADRAGGITTDMALRCVAACLDYPSAISRDKGATSQAFAALDSAVLGSVAPIPAPGRREVKVPVSNYADPRRYVTDIWGGGWENWKWILQGDGEFATLPRQSRVEAFSSAQYYTAISWAMTGRSDGGYDPAIDGWADARGGRKATDLWTSLPLGDGYVDCYFTGSPDSGFKVVVCQAGPFSGSKIRRVYWFVPTRKTHSLRAIALFVAVFAVAAGAAYAATAASAGGSTAAGAGGASATGGGGAVAPTASAGAGSVSGAVATATQAVNAATQAIGAVGAVSAALNPQGAAPAPSVPVSKPAAPEGSWQYLAIAGALAAAYTLTN